MTLQVHLEARKYLPKVHLVLFRIVPIDCIAGKLLWGYALNWIKCVSETIYSLLPRHIPMSFSGRKKRKLERILIPQSCILKRSRLVIHKSVNLQYITRVCLDNGTNESSTKSLIFQVLSFFILFVDSKLFNSFF